MMMIKYEEVSRVYKTAIEEEINLICDIKAKNIGIAGGMT